jgi:hypothetical protein
MSKMTDEQVMIALRGETAINRARVIFSGELGRFEQAHMNADARGDSIPPIEWRRMEFEAVERIAEALASTAET